MGGNEIGVRRFFQNPETVRNLVTYQGKNTPLMVLFLVKASEKITALELSGGKNEIGKSLEETACIELWEETDLHPNPINIVPVISYKYTPVINGEEIEEKTVNVFLTEYRGRQQPTVKVGKTKNENGEPEDNHVGYAWMSPDQIRKHLDFIHPNSRPMVDHLLENLDQFSR